MQSDEVDLAAGAVAQEVSEVFERGGGPTVSYGRGAEPDLVAERLNILAIGRHALVDGHACLTAVVAPVRLVEGENGVGASIDGSLCFGRPDRFEVWVIVEHQWDEGQGGIGIIVASTGVSRVVVVILPRYERVLPREGVRQSVGIVRVTESSLATILHRSRGRLIGCLYWSSEDPRSR